ncbi:MAG: DUF2851 family protein [Chlorobi bacterium]|nr:DUF2851 family protein [Chlorobiota bacterium]
MTEEFLHYIWKFKLYGLPVKLVTGEQISILETGQHNFNSGPDFFNAKIKIGKTLWAGNVEIHIKSSDWFAHKHQNDKAYDNIILHVVYENDKNIKRKNGESIPVVEMKGVINRALFERYQVFMTAKTGIPCQTHIHEVDRFIINNWLDRLLVERLEQKATEVDERLKFNGNNWEQTLYEFMARNFGFKVNAVPFELLSQSLPLIYLGKHKNNKHQIEALLFGQAGLLSGNCNDEYFVDLKKEYEFLKRKFSLIPIDPHLWRFMRLRPSNFPTIRIAEFADLIFKSSHLFSNILECEKFSNLLPLFDVKPSTYWDNHYTFGKESTKRKKKLGKAAIHLIAINTIIPFVFIYGRIKNEQKYIDRALKFLDQIPGESNSIVKKWEEMGMGTQTAFNTQALLQLKNSYCNKKRCLDCSIGNALLLIDK